MAAIQTDNGATSASQTALSATTLTDVFTCSRRAVKLVSIFVCNRGAGATTFRIAIAYLGIADDVSQYLFYDEAIAANTTRQIEFSASKVLGFSDVIRAYTAGASVSVNIECVVVGGRGSRAEGVDELGGTSQSGGGGAGSSGSGVPL